MAVRHLNCQFKVKKATKNSVTIEGFANAATIDRMKEKINPQGWQLDNYKNNPIVLFDHGHDPTFGFMPIGKAIEIEAQAEGLYTKIQLSSSKSEKISAIRDLVEEGILKTFSVGFEPKNTEKSADDPDVTIITQAELLETSIVPIPMNQDSTFSILSKRYRPVNEVAKKWTDSFFKKIDLIKKGAFPAAAIHQRLSDLEAAKEIRNMEHMLKYAADEAGMTVTDVKKFLDGDKTKALDALICAFASILKLDREVLRNLKKGDDLVLKEKVLGRAGDQTLVTDEAKGEECDTSKEEDGAEDEKAKDSEYEKEDEKEDETEEKAMDDSSPLVVHAVMIPAESADSEEAAVALAESHGWSATSSAQQAEDGSWVVEVNSGEGLDLENGYMLDMGNGVMAHVVPKMGETSETAEAEDVEDVEQELSADVDDEKNMDEGKDEDSEDKEDEKSIKGVDNIDDNPYLELSRQNNVLLGTLINEIQQMSKKLDGVVQSSVTLAKESQMEDDEKEPTDEESEKSSHAALMKYRRDLDMKLKKLNV